MIHALMLALLVTGAAEKHPSHPKPPAKHAAPKPPPPPAQPQLADDPMAEPEEPEEPDDLDVHITKKKKSSTFSREESFARTEYTEEQYQAIGAATLCCCFLFVAGLIALIVFLVKRASAPATRAPAPGPMGTAPPPPMGAPSKAVPFQLSVLAIGMHAPARQLVAQQLILSGAQADPATAADRAQLVRELSKAVRGLETEWTHFGYGERLDLPDELAAQRSYQLAVEDFGRRSADSSLSGESTYAVMTLVMCTRRQLRGVTALDDRAQIRTLLEDRAALLETDLMGAYIAWSLPLGGHEVLTRFPEMHAVR